MANTLTNRRRRLRWRYVSMLDDLPYADYIVLLASYCAHMQDKSSGYKRLQVPFVEN